MKHSEWLVLLIYDRVQTMRRIIRWSMGRPVRKGGIFGLGNDLGWSHLAVSKDQFILVVLPTEFYH